MLKVPFLIRETTTTDGTGTYTLDGAIDGHFSFSDVGDGNTVPYVCTDGTDVEFGLGTYTASGTTLSRTTIYRSSNGDAAVNWTGGKAKAIYAVEPNEHLEAWEVTRGTYSSETYIVAAANDSGTNCHLGILPKGNGALVAAIPDGTATGGNQRGQHAVDLQTNRSNANEVASGNQSVIVGGLRNRVDGDYGVGIGGRQIIVTGDYGFAGGGWFLTVTGDYASAPGGYANTANGDYSHVTGCRAHARGIEGAHVRASGRFSSNGDAQNASYHLRVQTTSGTAGDATADGAAVSSTNIPVMPDDSCYMFEARVVARRTDTGTDCGSWIVRGQIKRNTGAGSTSVSGVATTIINEDDASWDVTAVADTTVGGLKIQCTGAASQTIRWSVDCQTTEVTE